MRGSINSIATALPLQRICALISLIHPANMQRPYFYVTDGYKLYPCFVDSGDPES
jgi:hypothetical protein